MARTEQAELNELHLTPEQLAARQDHVKQLINDGATRPASANDLNETKPVKTARRTRSDKGTHKPPKAKPEAQGALTNIQKERIWVFIAQIDEARRSLEAVSEVHERIKDEFADFLNSLTRAGE